MNYWRIAPGENAEFWSECVDGNYICAGWDDMGNYKANKNEDEIYKKLISNGYGDNPSKHKKNIWNFANNVKAGDIIFANKGMSKILGVGIAISGYIAPNTKNNIRTKYQSIIMVKWLKNIKTTTIYKETTKLFTRSPIQKLDNDDSRILEVLKNNDITFNQLIDKRNKILKEKQLQKYIDILKFQKQIILQGPPGTGKTYLAKKIANELCGEQKENQKLIVFHPSYGYEDFIRGIEAKTQNSDISYEVVDKILLKIASKALASKDENFVLIIDEINRANLSAVLGELIYALEYRGEPANCMYDKNGSREIILPENLYIIGTMNTADRSVGYIDYAIRRRFAFVDVLADKSLAEPESRFDEVREIIKEGISSEYNVDDIMIGHSYFMGKNLEEKMKYQVIPLLKEYVKDGLLTLQTEKKIKELED